MNHKFHSLTLNLHIHGVKSAFKEFPDFFIRKRSYFYDAEDSGKRGLSVYVVKGNEKTFFLIPYLFSHSEKCFRKLPDEVFQFLLWRVKVKVTVV